MNASSTAFMTCGGSDDEHERMKRSLLAFTTSALSFALARMSWCIVGTPVYQVGSTSRIQPKNLDAL